MLETLLSVIIPVYNVEPYLEQCLDSVINQTYKNMEIICINDGSTDNSLKILEKYKLKDKRIKVISQENKGQSEARNAGLKIAKGKYIGFIDADDFVDSTMYEKLVTPMIKDPSIDFSVAGINCVSEKGTKKVCDRIKWLGEKGKSRATFPISNYYGFVWNKVFKNSIIKNKKIDFAKPKPKIVNWEDQGFMFAYLINSKYSYWVPEYLYNWRIRSNSTGNLQNNKKYEVRKLSCWRVGAYTYEYLTKNNLFEQNREHIEDWLKNAARWLSGPALNTFHGKWEFIKEFWKFLSESDYPVSGKISLSYEFMKYFSFWCIYKLTN